MHSNLSISDGVYGGLSEQDVKKQIAKLGEKIANEETQDLAAKLQALEETISQIKTIMGV